MHFLPPLDRPFVTRVSKLLMPLVRRFKYGGLAVELTPRAVKILTELSGPAILAPNHPTRDDPAVMFEVSRQARHDYNFVAAYEVFEESSRFEAWLIRAIGGYSVVRGTVDRESFRMTRQLLAERARTIVIFIEGTAPYQNDSLLPFQPGVVQLGFWALEDAVKAGRALTSLPVIPLCIKYVFPGDAHSALEALLARLEVAVLGAEAAGAAKANALLDRVRALGLGILQAMEENNAVPPPKDATLGGRVDRLKEALLSRAETVTGVKVRPGTDYTDRVFAVRRAADTALLGVIEGATDYQRRLFDERRRALSPLYRDLDRLTLFSNFHDEYLTDYPSLERIADVLDRLYREAHGGRAAPLPPRLAVVDAGDPVDLAQHHADYTVAKKPTVADITLGLHEQTTGMLEHLYKTRTQPIESSRG